MRTPSALVLLAVTAVLPASLHAAGLPLWQDRQPKARLVQPRIDDPMKDIVNVTVNGNLAEWCGWTLPQATKADQPGLYIVAGDERNNAVVAELVRDGLKLDRADLGDEGFQIVTHAAADRKFIVITANTPVGLKHGCQELVFFRISTTAGGATVDWPLNVRMKPAFAYRGTYMLPCWSAYDSLENCPEKGTQLFLLTSIAFHLAFPAMPRHARVAHGGLVYHVLNRAMARLPLLQKPEDYHYSARS